MILYIIIFIMSIYDSLAPHPGARARGWNVPIKTRTRTRGHTCACASARTHNK